MVLYIIQRIYRIRIFWILEAETGQTYLRLQQLVKMDLFSLYIHTYTTGCHGTCWMCLRVISTDVSRRYSMPWRKKNHIIPESCVMAFCIPFFLRVLYCSEVYKVKIMSIAVLSAITLNEKPAYYIQGVSFNQFLAKKKFRCINAFYSLCAMHFKPKFVFNELFCFTVTQWCIIATCFLMNDFEFNTSTLWLKFLS